MMFKVASSRFASQYVYFVYDSIMRNQNILTKEKHNLFL